MAHLGIDFGTSALRVAVAPAGGRPAADEVIEVPAVFSFHEGRITVGEIVLLTAGLTPDVVVHGAKRLLGRAPGDPLLERLAARDGLSLRAHGRGDLWLGARTRPEEPGVSLERAVAALIEHAVEIASGERHGHDVVLTVPAWYGPAQRAALLAAAERAHLHVERFVLDTVAAALSIDLHETAGVVDCGAGGVSAAVLGGRPLTLIDSEGDGTRGGDEMVDEVMAATGVVASGADREVLRRAAIDLIAELATATELSRSIDLAAGPVRIGASRWEIDILIGTLAERVGQVCATAAADVPIDRAYGLGGMMGHPVVREAVERRWGAVETLPETAPAIGAAIAAASLANRGHVALHDGETRRPIRPSSLPPGLGAPTSSRLAAPSRPRPEVTRRRLSAAEIRAKRQSVGLTPTPASATARAAPPIPSPPSGPFAASSSAPTMPAPARPDPDPAPARGSDAAWPHEGTVAPPQRPEDVIGLPMVRPLRAADLDPVALPVLLRRVLCRPGVRGTLRLEGPGIRLALPVEEKSALVTKEDVIALRRAFDAPRLRWRLDPFAHDGAPRQARPLSRLGLEGLRRMLRLLTIEDLERALGPRLRLLPRIDGDASSLARRLELDPRQRRLLDHLDGATPLEALGASSGIGALATLSLVALLEIYDALRWSDVPSVSDLLADRADRWERAPAHEVLGLDPDAPPHAIDQAYAQRRRDYLVGSAYDQACPEACAAIRHRLDEAHQTLRREHTPPPDLARSSSPGRGSQP